MPRRSRGRRGYSRMARVNELCRHILAEEIELLDDDHLALVTVTHVAVDPDLRRATVDVAALGEDEDDAVAALARHRVRLQSAIARQARLKRTPELSFRVDQAIAAGARIEEILRRTRPPPG